MTLPQHFMCVCVCVQMLLLVCLCISTLLKLQPSVYVRACLLDHLWHRQTAFLNAE